MGTGVDADRGTGSAAKAREPGVALLFRRASALALVGMAAFTDIVITRRRAGWPVRRVSVRSRITRQSPAYAPFVAFADGSAAAPAIASADTARRIRFITECQRPSVRSSSGCGTLRFPKPFHARQRSHTGTRCLSSRLISSRDKPSSFILRASRNNSWPTISMSRSLIAFAHARQVIASPRFVAPLAYAVRQWRDRWHPCRRDRGQFRLYRLTAFAA